MGLTEPEPRPVKKSLGLGLGTITAGTMEDTLEVNVRRSNEDASCDIDHQMIMVVQLSTCG
eukprot:scaffold1783_cov71-Attheya_sp.AAC.2